MYLLILIYINSFENRKLDTIAYSFTTIGVVLSIKVLTFGYFLNNYHNS